MEKGVLAHGRGIFNKKTPQKINGGRREKSSNTESIKKSCRYYFSSQHSQRYFPDLNFVTFSLTSVRPDCVGAVLDS